MSGKWSASQPGHQDMRGWLRRDYAEPEDCQGGGVALKTVSRWSVVLTAVPTTINNR